MNVDKIDNFIKLKKVIVSCANKEGLVSNKRADNSIIDGLPEDGLIGELARINPDIEFICTGNTYKLLSGYNAVEVSNYTGYPSMKSGLVKSLHPSIHAGLLAHWHTPSDAKFMQENNLDYIDAAIVNFYPLDKALASESFETLRQLIDIGGPTLAHSARKAMLSTALITEPGDYNWFLKELKQNNGQVSMKTRLFMAKKASTMITRYMDSVNEFIQRIEIKDLEESYTFEND